MALDDGPASLVNSGPLYAGRERDSKLGDPSCHASSHRPDPLTPRIIDFVIERDRRSRLAFFGCVRWRRYLPAFDKRGFEAFVGVFFDARHVIPDGAVASL